MILFAVMVAILDYLVHYGQASKEVIVIFEGINMIDNMIGIGSFYVGIYGHSLRGIHREFAQTLFWITHNSSQSKMATIYFECCR